MIKTKNEYRQAFDKIDILISEMGDDLERQKEARLLAEEIQEYEKDNISFPAPTTLLGMIEFKMYEMKLKRKDLAIMLGVEASRVSEIMNGKRKINVEIAKGLHEKLGIDGNFILEKI
ncbi:type II toxin-antitoxin system HigA family antitoxin [Persicitalea sp.]|uniref:helix-turn-helix domain-containing protein n=1 Tax=Persicitalea sp. TaxID=3100273 RepID=UPI0035935524